MSIRPAYSPSPALCWPAGNECCLQRGERLFMQGESTTAVFVLRDGLVELARAENNGNEAVLTLASPPAVLGLACAIHNLPHDCTAFARTACLMSRYSLDWLKQLQINDPRFSAELCKILGAEALHLVKRFSALACTPARTRLQQYLLDLANSQQATQGKNEVRICFPLSECDVARHLSITPVHLSRLLAQAEREGLLKRTKGWLLLYTNRLRPNSDTERSAA